MLFRLRQQEGLSQVDLADVLELQPISLVRLLDRLVEQGCWSGGPIRRIGAPTGCFLTKAGDSWSTISTACAIPSPPTCCKIFPTDAIRTSLETLEDIKERIKSSSEHAGDVAAK